MNYSSKLHFQLLEIREQAQKEIEKFLNKIQIHESQHIRFNNPIFYLGNIYEEIRFMNRSCVYYGFWESADDDSLICTTEYKYINLDTLVDIFIALETGAYTVEYVG